MHSILGSAANVGLKKAVRNPQRLLLPGFCLLLCFHGSSCDKTEVEPSGGSAEHAPEITREAEPVVLQDTPQGISCVSWVHNGEPQTHIALECRVPGNSDSDDSIVMLPWSDSEHPRHLHIWVNQRWQPCTQVSLLNGVLVCTRRNNPDELPSVEEWFDGTREPSLIGIRTVEPKLSAAEKRLKERTEEKRKMNIEALQVELDAIDLEIRELRNQQASNRIRRPPSSRNRSPYGDLTRERSRIQEQLVRENRRAPDFDVEYLALTKTPEAGDEPATGYAVSGRQLVGNGGSLSDSAELLEKFKPSLSECWAWIDWHMASILNVRVEGKLNGFHPAGSTLRIQPADGYDDTLQEAAYPSRIGSDGQFTTTMAIDLTKVEEAREVNLNLVLANADGQDVTLGKWSAVLHPSHWQQPVELIHGDENLPWQLKPGETSAEPTADIPITSRKDYPVDGRILKVIPADRGLQLVVLTENPSRLSFFDLRSGEWIERPDIETSGEILQVAADAERVFVIDDGGNRLRSIRLEDGETLAETILENPLLDIAAGYASTSGPLVLLDADSFQLRDPATLAELERIHDPRHSSRSTTLTESQPTAIHRKADKHPVGNIHAAPDSSSFSLEIRPDPDRSSRDSWVLSREGSIWTSTRARTYPGWQGIKYTTHELITPDDPKPNRIQIDDLSAQCLIPTFGRGHLCVHRESPKTFPSRGFRMAYYTEKHGLALFSGGSLARDHSNILRDRIWFDPINAQIISANDTRLQVEQVDPAAFAEAISRDARIMPPPPANPGSRWTYAPTANDSQIELKSIKPQVEIGLHDDLLVWDVPRNVSGETIEIELAVGGDPVSLQIPIGNLAPVQWMPKDGKPTTLGASVIPVGKIDHMVPIPDSSQMLLIHTGGTGVSLFDVAQGRTLKDIWLPGGIGFPASDGKHLLIYYPEMEILETRNLKDFSPITTKPLSFDLPVKGISVSQGGAIRVVLLKSFHEIEIVELDRESLAPINRTPVSGPRLKDPPGLLDFRTSSDGSIILAGNELLRTEDGTWKTADLPSTIKSHNGSHISIGPDSFTVYGGKGLYDIDTRRVWEAPVDQPTNLCCIPATKAGRFLVAHQNKDSYSLEIRDSDNKELLATLRDLSEFTAGTQLPAADVGRRTVYMPSIRTLVTLAIGDQDLVIRRLPPLDTAQR